MPLDQRGWTGGSTRAGARPRLALVGLLAAVAIAACGQRPANGPTGPDPRLPTPPDAVLTVGADGPAFDNGVPFVAYRSDEEPDDARDSLEAKLASEGFEVARRGRVWTRYERTDLTLWIAVAETGPPTSIVIRYDDGSLPPGAVESTLPDATPTSGGPEALVPTPEPPVRGGPLPSPTASPLPPVEPTPGPGKGDQGDKPGNGNNGDKPGKGNQGDKPGNGNKGNPGNGNNGDKPGKGNQKDKPGKGNQKDKPGKGNQKDKPGKGNQKDKPGKGNRSAAANGAAPPGGEPRS